jgi:hypothetical protein
MNKIYIVTSGSYSDYQINAVFSTRELAQKYVDKFESTDYRVEEHELDTGTRNYDKSLYHVSATYTEGSRSGISSNDRWESVYFYEETTEAVPISVEEKNTSHLKRMRNFSGIVHAKDKKHALKILGEFTFSYNTQNPLPWLK